VFDAIEFDGTEGSYGHDHISHCLDAVREAIMCMSDISVTNWARNEKANKALGHGDIVHSCRNFDRMRDWAYENRGVVDFNNEIYVQDAVVVTD
jgi:hypothetical protein